MGPIGVVLNGIPFYNQYAGGGAALNNEINSFDQYGVELGKKVALDISKKLANKEKNINTDSSTQNLIDIYIKSKEKNSEN